MSGASENATSFDLGGIFYEFDTVDTGTILIPDINEFRQSSDLNKKLKIFAEEFSTYCEFLEKFNVATDSYLQKNLSQVKLKLDSEIKKISQIKIPANCVTMREIFEFMRSAKQISAFNAWLSGEIFKLDIWNILQAHMSRTAAENIKSAVRQIEFKARYLYLCYIDFKHIFGREIKDLKELRAISEEFNEYELLLLQLDGPEADKLYWSELDKILKVQRAETESEKNLKLVSAAQPLTHISLTKGIEGYHVDYKIRFLIDFEANIKEQYDKFTFSAGLCEQILNKFDTIKVVSEVGLKELALPYDEEMIVRQREISINVNKIFEKRNKPTKDPAALIAAQQSQSKDSKAATRDAKYVQVNALRKSIDSHGKVHPEQLFNQMKVSSILNLLHINDIDTRIQKLMTRHNLSADSIINIAAADRKFTRTQKQLFEFL